MPDPDLGLEYEFLEDELMRILALETSSREGTVAVLENDRLVGQTALDRQRRTTQAFAPAMAAQLAAVGWRPEDIRLVAVTQGPGSFTGLRVGVTAAKAFAYAVGAEVIGVNTLAVIAFQSPPQVGCVEVVLDAQRQQLFAGQFVRRGDRWEVRGVVRVVDQAAWLAGLQPGWAVSGAGLRPLRERLPEQVTVVDEEFWPPQAAAVGRLAYLEYQTGKRDDVWTLVPHYYRPSAAEEKAAGATTGEGGK